MNIYLLVTIPLCHIHALYPIHMPKSFIVCPFNSNTCLFLYSNNCNREKYLQLQIKAKGYLEVTTAKKMKHASPRDKVQ